MYHLISIIMPIYNSSKYLKESIQSVIDQSYENWELICVDDGSTDNSLEIIRSYESKKIKVYSQENSGPAQARKLGISKSKGEFICCLDSDDAYSNDYLYETLKQAIRTNSDVTMPTLIQRWKSNEEYNFNEKHNLKFNEIISPRKAFLRTFPWSVHSCNLYKASHMKKYALTDISNVNNFNADEYLARYLLLFSNKITVSKGTYFYRYNVDSITKKFSMRQFSSLKVDRLLFKLAKNEKFDNKEISILSKQLLNNKVALKYSYISNFTSLSAQESNSIESILKCNEPWIPHVRINNLKDLKYYTFLKTDKKFLLPLLKARIFLKGIFI